MMYTVMPYRRAARPMRPDLMIDRMFRDFCGMPVRGQHPQPGFRVDVRQTPEAYIVEAELPGVKLEDMELTVENDVLTIAANVNQSCEDKREGYLHCERRSGRMERRFTLEGIRQADITAASADGILTVTLPKEVPEAGHEKRRIAIAGAAPAAAIEAPEAE